MHNLTKTVSLRNTQGQGPGAVVKAVCLESREIAGSNPALAFKFQ